MLNGLAQAGNLNILIVFAEGLLSFFSPCVLPMLPIYMGYLAGNALGEDAEGRLLYDRRKVFGHTVAFIVGISFAFFILGLSFTALGSLINANRTWFERIGGLLIIAFGLVQLGWLRIPMLQRTKKFEPDLRGREMNPLLAGLLGFSFSFAWTPCVGPALSSVLVLASGAQSMPTGNLLVLVYTLGFVIPFLALGLFTTRILNFLKEKPKILQYAAKAGGILLVIMGLLVFTGQSVRFGNSLPPQTSGSGAAEQAPEQAPAGDEGEAETLAAFDFTLTDQYGTQHTLSDYKGKVVFLNFWATWCGPCKQEMPHIQALYEEYNKNQGDVVFLAVANPSSESYPDAVDGTKEEILQFLTNNGYTYPVVFDETGKVFSDYFVNAYPTTYMIDKNGDIYGYISGSLTKDAMIRIIEQTLEGKRTKS